MLEKIQKSVIEELRQEYPEMMATSLTELLARIFDETGERFVSIIDEWDCIFREKKENEQGYIAYLDFLRNLLKDRSYVGLAYMTGILPIKKYGSHSALNMFTEFSMTNPRGLAAFVGFTDEEVQRLCDKYGMDYTEAARWYDGYTFRKESHIYSPKSVVDAMLNEEFDSYWTQTETYDALKMYIEMNYDGLRDAVIEMLSGGRVKVNTATFQNDMTTFQTKDDVLTLLIHLGYLAYDSDKEEVFIPNYEVSKEYRNALQGAGWNRVMQAIQQSEQLLQDTWNRKEDMMNNFTSCFNNHDYILMEGALGERLKREYQLDFDTHVVMGNLVYSQQGRHALKCLWHEYAQIAYQHGLPFIATTPTRRVNGERVALAGYTETIIRDNVEYLKAIKEEQKCEMYIGGMLGCKGDAYTGHGCLNEEESQRFHSWEIEQFVSAGVDFLYAALIPTVEEALGIARAISQYQVPYIISFTIKADGCLIDGTPISKAIDLIDHAVASKPLCYMTNCVHPNIAYEAVTCPINDNALVKERFLGIQANTSELPYDKLDGSAELKSSSPEYLAECMMRLQSVQKLKIIGGCCGTDNRHMNAIAEKLVQ